MNRTSLIFKVCYIAALLAPLCAVVAQGAVTLLILPAHINQELTIPSTTWDTSIDVPWSADETLAPFNTALIGVGKPGTSRTHPEQTVGASVGDTMPPGYLVPLRTSTNNTAGSQYPTDVAHIHCECSWVAPTLPPATPNVSYIPVVLDVFGIQGIQTIPHGIASVSSILSIASLHLTHGSLSVRTTLQYDIFEFHTCHFWAVCLDPVVS